MKSYQEMTREELLAEKALLKAEYKKYQAIYDALYGATADLAHKLSE